MCGCLGVARTGRANSPDRTVPPPIARRLDRRRAFPLHCRFPSLSSRPGPELQGGGQQKERRMAAGSAQRLQETGSASMPDSGAAYIARVREIAPMLTAAAAEIDA